MTGTQNHEGLAGITAAIDYLASLSVAVTSDAPRRQRLCAAFAAIREYETRLTQRLLDGLAARPRFHVWGVTKREQLAGRVPTVSITATGHTPQQIAEHLASREIYVWNGNMYGLELTERLGLEATGGVVRLGLVHYNTFAEIDRLMQALDELGESAK
jgi:selenocysteine lyase/cysteine desulfurase